MVGGVESGGRGAHETPGVRVSGGRGRWWAGSRLVATCGLEAGCEGGVEAGGNVRAGGRLRSHDGVMTDGESEGDCENGRHEWREQHRRDHRHRRILHQPRRSDRGRCEDHSDEVECEP